MVLAALRASARAQPRFALTTLLRPFTAAATPAEQVVREKLVAALQPTHVEVQDTSGAPRST